MSDDLIRKSQAIYSYSTGAIINLSSSSVMNLAVNKWRGKVIHDRRLEELFGVEKFIEPPEFDPEDEGYGSYISVRRFPNSYSCIKCGRISFLEELNSYHRLFPKQSIDLDQKYFCPICYWKSLEEKRKGDKPILTPTRFIITTAFGHIDDFPWDWFVHRSESKREFRRKGSNPCYYKKDKDKPEYENKDGFHLRLNKPKGAALAALSVECLRCGAIESLKDIFTDSVFNNYQENDKYLDYIEYKMPKPWMGKDKEYQYNITSGLKKPEDTDELKDFYQRLGPRTLQRGASNAHFPVTHTGISIPSPVDVFTDEQKRKIYTHAKFAIKLGALPEHFVDEEFVETIEHDIEMTGITVEQLVKVLNEKELSVEVNNYKDKEYAHLKGENEYDETSEFYFENKVHKASEYYGLPFITQVSVVSKLRLLNILRGFTRLRPLAIEEVKFHNDIQTLNQRLHTEYSRINDVRMYPENSKWLPAVEIRGEGIFIEFNDSHIQKWTESDKAINERITTIRENYKSNLSKFDPFIEEEAFSFITPKYVLLHTISHLLIEEIARSSGYINASMAEIIYADDDMSGILIYTSSSDAEGTLGGLSLKGKPSHLESIFKNALEKSKWCSSDPICIESSSGQGFMGVNLAACHSCAMLPETSCETMNRFLDRALLHGTLDKPSIGFLNYISNHFI
tara:strand:- start:141528 stop:143570 length:2043 start_codon:yes stop_codon:yes gene_type:complete